MSIQEQGDAFNLSETKAGLVQFDAMTYATDGYIEVPKAVIASLKKQIKHMMPDEWRFISSGSTQIDSASGRLTIDTEDTIPEKPTNLKTLESRPAAMRVLHGMGSKALNGFVIDFRRVKSLVFDNRGLSEGVGSSEFMDMQARYGAELPLGAVFEYFSTVHYIGHPDATDAALYLAQQVDVFVQALEENTSQPEQAQVL